MDYAHRFCGWRASASIFLMENQQAESNLHGAGKALGQNYVFDIGNGLGDHLQEGNGSMRAFFQRF